MPSTQGGKHQDKRKADFLIEGVKARAACAGTATQSNLLLLEEHV